jgi:hypothetical protein
VQELTFLRPAAAERYAVTAPSRRASTALSAAQATSAATTRRPSVAGQTEYRARARVDLESATARLPDLAAHVDPAPRLNPQPCNPTSTSPSSNLRRFWKLPRFPHSLPTRLTRPCSRHPASTASLLPTCPRTRPRSRRTRILLSTSSTRRLPLHTLLLTAIHPRRRPTTHSARSTVAQRRLITHLCP